MYSIIGRQKAIKVMPCGDGAHTTPRLPAKKLHRRQLRRRIKQKPAAFPSGPSAGFALFHESYFRGVMFNIPCAFGSGIAPDGIPFPEERV